MNILPSILLGILGLVFLWGVVSPRSQWQALVGWTRSDARESEPGTAAYATGRVVSLVGLMVLVSILVSWVIGSIVDNRAGPVRPPSIAEDVWGEPRSYVVDRVFTPLAVAPETLVPQAITGYQAVDASGRFADYLYSTGRIRSAGLATQPGFLGVVPLPGTVALDTGDLVVHVLGDDRCIPQQVTVITIDGAVQIGVFFGQPVGDAVDVANCDPNPPIARTRGFLIPVDLLAPLGDRVVQSLDGTPLELQPVPRR